MWTALLPVFACAVCPVCLSTWAKVLAMFGIAFGLSEDEHFEVLAIALGISLTVSAWRTYHTRRAWPLIGALVGSLLIGLGHFAGDIQALEWAGVIALVGSSVFERIRVRRAGAAA